MVDPNRCLGHLFFRDRPQILTDKGSCPCQYHQSGIDIHDIFQYCRRIKKNYKCNDKSCNQIYDNLFQPLHLKKGKNEKGTLKQVPFNAPGKFIHPKVQSLLLLEDLCLLQRL